VYPEDRPAGQAPFTPEAVPAALTSIPGVAAIQLVRAAPRTPDRLPGLISCADLARTPGVGACPPGAAVAQVFTDLLDRGGEAATVWPDAGLSAAALATYPLVSVVVLTDGSDTALERARTMLEAAFPDTRPPSTEADWRTDFARTLVQFQRLADVVIVASLVIAGCSLAVSITGGINERARPFSLLRLAGVRLAELRRVVALESAVPLLTVAALAIGAGFLAAHLFLRSQMHYTLHAPGPAYYLIVALGLALSLGLIASTMPLLRRVTGPAAARNE
jgi:predicted lysophospholipase L1 biosynthesis ABC-type transport system permease subunit